MNDAVLSVAINLTGSEQVSSGLNNVSNTVKSSTNILTDNRMAFRELAMGMTQIGVAAMSVGIMMKQSNNQTIQNIGTFAMLAGGIMSAVGSSVQFISAISKMVDALKKLQLAEIMTQAFSGPAGWVALGVGVAATAAVVGVSTYSKVHEKATTNNVTVHVQGSVISEKGLVNAVQKGLSTKWQQSSRNPIQSSLTP